MHLTNFTLNKKSDNYVEPEGKGNESEATETDDDTKSTTNNNKSASKRLLSKLYEKFDEIGVDGKTIRK